ncbi:MAG: DUF3870 domain-containing protein [Sporomusaceae bacterium]|nr:DUF3870 domain-containing protein [Sporomusaceae bacterium]
MMEYAPTTVFITGVAKPAKDDPIANDYQVFFLSLVVDKTTDMIVDATCNTARDMTKDFIRSLLVGRNLATESGEMVADIRRRFHGLAQKPLIVALKDAYNRYTVLGKADQEKISC